MKLKIEIDIGVKGVNKMEIEFDLNNMILTTVDFEGVKSRETFTKQQLPKMLDYFSKKMVMESL